MLLMSPSALMALESRVDVIMTQPGIGISRTASYDNAQSWPQPWSYWLGLVPLTPGFPPVSADLQDIGAACAASGDGRIMHLCARQNSAGYGAIYYRRTEDFSNSWTPAWSAIGKGVFSSSPAMATSGDGQWVIVVGIGTDNKIWSAVSTKGGQSWDLAWAAIGAGTFLHFTPAVACSADGKHVYAFGQGTDSRIWFAYSSTGGFSWDMAWSPIDSGKLSSGPAAVVSADGQRLLVFGRGTDDKMYSIRSSNGGATWDSDWTVMPAGANFQSGPAAAASWDAKTVHVFALGGDNRVWRAKSTDSGSSWATAWSTVGTQVF